MSDQSSSTKYMLPPQAIIQEVSQLVSKITGVQLGERQFVMVQTRLKKRMMDLHLNSDAEYLAYLRANKESEVEALVSLLTTHHTSFFREYSHFEYLEREGLPLILKSLHDSGKKTLRIWSAACSNGQEVYTLSMFLSYILPKMAPGMTFEIYGTDVAPQSVATAQNGVYLRKETKEIPLHFLADHWAKGTGDIVEYVKAKKSIKDPCTFETLNLLHINEKLLNRKFDIIFCRNVFIYFNADQIKSITQDLLKHLEPQGLLVIGISESLNGLDLPVTIRGPSIYSHPMVTPTAPLAEKIPSASPTSSMAPIPSAPLRPAILRVLCVDDSSSILTLLKQVLKKEAGFEVVGTAMNGLEAAKKVAELKPDLMTLDIHMPEQDGIEYLKGNYKSSHPPVIMVSSVSRETSDLALKALELGASDYVEKPSLSNLAQRGDEIRMKLNYAYQNRQAGQRPNLSLDKSFSTQPVIKNPDAKLRIVIAGLQNRKQLKELLTSMTGSQPPTLVLIEGADSTLTSISSQWIGEWGRAGQLIGAWPTPIKSGEIYLGDLTQLWPSVAGGRDKRKVSILVFGVISKAAAEKVGQWTGAQILVEDLVTNQKGHPLLDKATDWVPATSFAYMSAEYLGDDHG